MPRPGLVSSGNSGHDGPRRVAVSFLKSRWLRFFGLFTAVLFGVRIFVLNPSQGGIPEDYAATNPWRDLPPSPAVHETIREVLFIGDTLRDGMLPTSLPDDDYDMYSAMLSSLETRTDLTWLVVQETGIDKTIMAIANRGGHQSPIPEEPHDLHRRAQRLHDHWFTLASAKDKPDRWEIRFDTTSLPPLASRHSPGSGSKADSSDLHLTVEQKLAADTKYRAYRKRRDRAVSYLKSHPPKPMAWVPVQTGRETSRSVWETLFDDGIVQAGRKVMGGKLAGNPMFKPVYRELITERVPYDWVNPDEPVVVYTDKEHVKEMEAFREELRARQDRTDRQAKFQEKLRAEERLKRGGKQEL
ncbi:hypothetical protein LZ32DRAFT_385488 [Colletotrichum eremochloae]|nr:hypothetical protein LZ32DRAFT_385488 [Colletotrichum eremochloae]